jgi:hypothetical protein
MRWSEADYLSRIVLAHAPRQVAVSLILGVRQNMKLTPEEHLSRVLARFPRSNPKLTGFSSGEFMIDLEIRGEALVIEYLPSFEKYGVSRVSTAVFGWEGVENTFDTFEEVESYLTEISKIRNEN